MIKITIIYDVITILLLLLLLLLFLLFTSSVFSILRFEITVHILELMILQLRFK